MKKSEIKPAVENLLRKRESKRLLTPKNWESLSDAEKRKAILLDAMKSLLVGDYKPTSYYEDDTIEDVFSMKLFKQDVWELGADNYRSLKKMQLQEALPEVAKCEVCQRGMLLLSCVRFNNHLTIGEYSDFSISDREGWAGLNAYVPFKERESMERVFENDWKMTDGENEFEKKYTDAKRVVLSLAIFLNAYLIGKFTPAKWVKLEPAY